MQFVLTMIFIITLLFLVRKYEVLTETINQPATIHLSSFNKELEDNIELTENKIQVPSPDISVGAEIYVTPISQVEDNGKNNGISQEIDQDLEFVKEILLQFRDWILTKLDDDLRKKVEENLDELFLSFDSKLRQEFSNEDIKKIKKSIYDAISPLLEPIIGQILEMVPKNIFDFKEFLKFDVKDEL